MSGQQADQERGAVLGVAIMTAIVCSVVAYLILFLATSQARQARFYHRRVRARYATEAAIVWAQQQLRANPAFCMTDGNGPLLEGLEEYQTKVTVTSCGAGNNHQIQARIANY